MAQGILQGMASGLLAAGAGLAVVSLLAPQPAGNRPPVPPDVRPPVEALGEPAEDGTATDAATAVATPPEGEAAPSPEAPSESGPRPSAGGEAARPGERRAVIDTAPSERPEAAFPEVALAEAPDVDAAGADAATGIAPSVAPEADPPDRADTQGAAPRVPLREGAPALSTAPPAPTIRPPPPSPAVETPAEPPADPAPVAPPPQAAEAEPTGPVAAAPSAGPPVRINRPDASEPTSAAMAEPPVSAAAPALRRFAAPFAAADPARPLLSVVLLDEGGVPDAPDRVAALPVPVSIALDPTRPDAPAAMASYRARGVEVLALADLPTGAAPIDAGAAYGSIFAALPEVVAVLDLGRGGLQGQSATIGPALDRLARDGRGAVLPGGGLGTALREAAAAGVPAAALLRDLDGEGQDERGIRRVLDDAARRAEQEGPAVVLARVRPETLVALDAWAGTRRAAEVSVAPVSAVLGQGMAEGPG